MGAFLDPAVMTFIGVISGIALVVALADVVLILRGKTAGHLTGLLPAVDSILVIVGFLMLVGTCFIIHQTLRYLATTRFGWNWDGAINSPIVVPVTAAQSYVNQMIRTTLSFVLTWLSGAFFFEVWCLLRMLYRRTARKLPIAS